jgi:hypothetical protein
LNIEHNVGRIKKILKQRGERERERERERDGKAVHRYRKKE